MTKEAFRQQIYRSLGTAAFMVVVLGMPHAGFMLWLLALPLGAWMVYSCYAAVAIPDLRKSQLTLLAIWVTAVLLVVGIHVVRHEMTRSDANALVAEIKRFQAQHGHYPESPDELGIGARAFHDKFGYGGYASHNGKPAFFYAVTYEPFSLYAYNFDSDSWIYIPD